MRISDRSSDVCSSDLLDRRLLDRLRRVEIGLARAQRDDVAAGALQLGRLGGDGDGRGRLDAVETRRDEGHDGFSWLALWWRNSPNWRGKPTPNLGGIQRSEEHTSELQSLMRIPYAVF